MNLTAKTFKEALETHYNYIDNECWLNALIHFYGDSLLKQNKQRDVITRPILLNLIGHTEESIKSGISINDLKPFFQKYRIQVRIFNDLNKIIFKYDPEVRNHHIKPLYV